MRDHRPVVPLNIPFMTLLELVDDNNCALSSTSSEQVPTQRRSLEKVGVHSSEDHWYGVCNDRYGLRVLVRISRVLRENNYYNLFNK